VVESTREVGLVRERFRAELSVHDIEDIRSVQTIDRMLENDVPLRIFDRARRACQRAAKAVTTILSTPSEVIIRSLVQYSNDLSTFAEMLDSSDNLETTLKEISLVRERIPLDAAHLVFV